MTITLDFFETPSHGYLQVAKSCVNDIGFKPSGYSYFNKRTQTYYLEEDCDAPEFITEAKNQGYTVHVTPSYIEDESKIRNNPRVAEL